jgi:hypothetical protein
MHKGGVSKRGFLHTLSYSSMRDPKDLPISSCTSLPIIIKVYAPWRSLFLPSILLVLLLCASSSFDVTTSLTIQGNLTLFSSILLPVLLVLSPGTSSLGSCLFNDLSSSALLSSVDISSAHPSSTVSFLFILVLTTRSSPLDLFSSIIYSIFLLSLTLIEYLSTIFLLFSSGSILFSPHLIFLWIPSTRSTLSFIFSSSPFFPSPPFTRGGRGVYSTILSRSMCVSPFSTNNIFIHGGISSNNLLLGLAANFVLALLKDSLHSIANSTI